MTTPRRPGSRHRGAWRLDSRHRGAWDPGTWDPGTWRPDRLLGEPYETLMLPLRDRSTAALVRRREAIDRRGATGRRGTVLYVHGFVDYFFQTHLADRLTAAGFAFYALDQRRSGRALADPAWYVRDQRECFEELDLACAIARETGDGPLIVLGHSTGGLLAALHARARPPHLGGPDLLALNSPWLDLHRAPLQRMLTRLLVRTLAPFSPHLRVSRALTDVYPRTISAAHEGRWEFDHTLKPVADLPAHLGWLAGVLTAQTRLHRGLALPIPVLQLRSDRSALGLVDVTAAAHRADTVLDVDQMRRRLPAIGPDVTDVAVPGAVHDVFLSDDDALETAFTALGTWLDAHAPRSDAGLPSTS